MKHNDSAIFWAEILGEKAMAAVERLLEGEEMVKIKRQDIVRKGIPTGHKKMTVTTWRSQPDVTTVIYMLERIFPERFARRHLQIPEIEICFQPTIEHHESPKFSNCSKEESADCLQWSAYISPNIEALRDRARNFFTPMLKAL